MVEEYLIGSIGQSLERARQLRQVVQRRYPREYDGLRQICLTKLNETQITLQYLAEETVVDTSLQTPRRVREFKRIVRQLNSIEGVGVFALSRTSPDDDFLNQLITAICEEISYPLISPTISHISQDYFHIYRDFNLLCLPLMESRFLLHLPDIYHELCHPFHQRQNADLPTLESYHIVYKRSLFEMVRHFHSESTAAERVRKPEGKIYQLQLWNNSWAKYWMQEFFCDLFGVLMAGPAFAWSHYHLCVKRGGDPFETPLKFESTHPADDARMQVVLMMLTRIGFETDAKRIEKIWQDFVEVMGYTPVPEYQQCYPESLLSEIVSAAQEGIEGTGVQTAKPDTLTRIVGLLNSAWQEFWRVPKDYQAWETARLETLRSATGTS
ncbi:MAG: hypothetical protein J4F35_15675 [Candidatus Latescibacteria bacterium]|nr:hypothetical protein [Candidatus Latescibacterota bacterium]